MARSLFFYMLVAAQLLSGSGGPRYLCISSDGSSCFDTGPASCTCCLRSGDQKPNIETTCSDDSTCRCGCHAAEGRPPSGNQSILSSAPCGCTHFLISAEQSTLLVRSTIEAERFWQHFICLPVVMTSETVTIPVQSIVSYRPPAVQNASLAVLSTVVIRC